MKTRKELLKKLFLDSIAESRLFWSDIDAEREKHYEERLLEFDFHFNRWNECNREFAFLERIKKHMETCTGFHIEYGHCIVPDGLSVDDIYLFKKKVYSYY